MNRLVAADESAWKLPNHAHIIVYETKDESELITVYDCGAAQKSPSAQLIGELIRIDADHERLSQPVGYIAKLREASVLERRGESQWLVRRR